MVGSRAGTPNTIFHTAELKPDENIAQMLIDSLKRVIGSHISRVNMVRVCLTEGTHWVLVTPDRFSLQRLRPNLIDNYNIG
jgi:hypothetical protein